MLKLTCGVWDLFLKVFKRVDVIRYKMEPMVVILGATGTGKSKLAIELATKFRGEIISADSMQIYQGLDIVTNKVTAEEQAQVKHHMLDFVNPLESYTVVEFRDAVLPIIDSFHKEGILPIVVGGTHYYVESILWKVLVQSDGNLDKFSRNIESLGKIISQSEDCKNGEYDLRTNKNDINSALDSSKSIKKSDFLELKEDKKYGCSRFVPSDKVFCKLPFKDLIGNCDKLQNDKSQLSDLYQSSEFCPINKSVEDSVINKNLSTGDSPKISNTIHSSEESLISLSESCDKVNENKIQFPITEIQLQHKDYNALSNEELLNKLMDIDPEMSSRYHPNDRRKILRSLEVWHQTGVRHSEHLRRQSEEVGGADLGGKIRFKNAFVLWITCDKDILNKRLDARVDDMLKRGLLQELSEFHASFNGPALQKTVETISPSNSDEQISDHYQKGIFQSIGLKEFHEYLLLDAGQQESDMGQKLLQKGVETMKIRTRQYAKRQDKWMRNRFLIRNREKLPVYTLDGNDLEKWDINVTTPAINIVESILRGETPFQQPLKLSSAQNVDTGDKTRHFCEVCQRIFIGNSQWEQHNKSKKHYAMVVKKNKLMESSPSSSKREIVNDLNKNSKVQKL